MLLYFGAPPCFIHFSLCTILFESNFGITSLYSNFYRRSFSVSKRNLDMSFTGLFEVDIRLQVCFDSTPPRRSHPFSFCGRYYSVNESMA